MSLHTSIPEDQHTPFIDSYEVKSQRKEVVFHFNITTKNLVRNLEESPSNLFQLDPTYKLISNDYPTFVHGTSNLRNEFYANGLAVCSNEDSEGLEKIFSTMKNERIKYFNL